MEKTKRSKKISTKLIVSIILVTFVLTAAACLVGYIQYDSTMRKLYNDNGYVIGELILDEIDHEKVKAYTEKAKTLSNVTFPENPEDEYFPDADYKPLRDYLLSVQDATGAKFVYIAIPNGTATFTDSKTGESFESVSLRYVCDSYGCPIGFVDPVPKYYDEFVSTYETGEKTGNYYVRYSESYEVYLTSCMLPIKDDTGDVVAILFVDIAMELIRSTLVGYILRVALISLVLITLFCIGYWLFMDRSVVRPIKVIGENARAFAENATVTDTMDVIKTGDEFEGLAHSIASMEHSIVDYIENIKTITAENERIGAELNVATQIQASMLPCIFPPFPDRDEFDVFATMDPAKEVGGDFYDFFMVDHDHIAIVMADVSGKGVPAALFMVIAKTLIKDHTAPGEDLGEVFSNVNNILCESNSGGMFVTAFEGVLDLRTGEFRFVNAGHETPFICKKGGKYEPYKIKAGFVLAGMEGMHYRGGVMTLEPGDKIFQYTDGVTEATDKNNKLYGMERLGKILADHSDKAPCDLLPAVKADIDAFVGEAPQFDDITMLCLEFKKLTENTEEKE